MIEKPACSARLASSCHSWRVRTAENMVCPNRKGRVIRVRASRSCVVRYYDSAARSRSMTGGASARGRPLECATQDRVRIGYTVFGTRGQPYILLHGWCCDQSLMAPLARHLGRTFRAVTLDLRGHGRSGRPAYPLKLGGFIDDVRAVARAAGIRRTVIIGHSMGGRIALALASAMPELVGACVLLDTAICEEPEYVAARWRQLSRGNFESALRSRISALCATPTLPSTASHVSSVMTAVTRRTALESLLVADALDAPGALASFAGPVL